jgi:hypothetical protein
MACELKIKIGRSTLRLDPSRVLTQEQEEEVIYDLSAAKAGTSVEIGGKGFDLWSRSVESAVWRISRAAQEFGLELRIRIDGTDSGEPISWSRSDLWRLRTC